MTAPGPAPASAPALEASNLSKRYGVVQALSSADLTLRAGQVHALMGTNGAGKSTLVKILTGAVVPDTGTVRLDGRPLALGDPSRALAAGIACIYQESNLVPALTVLDNVMLGCQPTKSFGRIDRGAQRATVSALLLRHGIKLDLDTPVQSLPTVDRKQVEIAKALARNAQVILMDEPTAWLSQVEVRSLFRSIRALTAQGISILYISHVLTEVFAIADNLSVVRDGRVVLTAEVAAMTPASLAQAMLGRELQAETDALRAVAPVEHTSVALECKSLTAPGSFHDISLAVRAGEIVCLTGLIGSGRSELFNALFGVEPAATGEVLVHGEPRRLRQPRQAISAGLGLVPEDRRLDGLMMNHSVRQNVVAAHLGRISRSGILRRGESRRLASRVVATLGIVPPRLETAVSTLSGGNQQKVLMGRWMAGTTDILLLDEPTVGIDVGAKADIYQQLRTLADQGTAILVISSDMEEALTLPDRILVMAAGRLVAEFGRGDASQEAILAAASGESE